MSDPPTPADTQSQGPAPDADVSGGTPNHTLHVSIALSTIIASIWAGVWGFDWAASHLPGGALFIAIVIGLVTGGVLTAYVSHEAFEIMREAIRLSSVGSRSRTEESLAMLKAPGPTPVSSWWERK